MTGKIWFIPAIMVVIGIFSLSTFLAIPFQVEGMGIDKWEHAFAYMVLVGTFLMAFHKNHRLTRRLSLIVLLLSAVYGLLLEYVQFFFFSYRYFEWLDAMANVLGAVLGFLFFSLWLKLKRG